MCNLRKECSALPLVTALAGLGWISYFAPRKSVILNGPALMHELLYFLERGFCKHLVSHILACMLRRYCDCHATQYSH